MKLEIDELWVIINEDNSLYPKIFTTKETAENFQKAIGGTIHKGFVCDRTD